MTNMAALLHAARSGAARASASRGAAGAAEGATRLEDMLAAHGHQVATVVNYDAKEKQVAANRSITTSVTVLGLPIVAISMVGLVNSITMSIIERTREIGVPRSVGARARDVRRIFASDGLVLSAAG
jgi:putative ABC transport system permease protein